MKKQLSLVLIFVVLFMGLSGCIFKGNENGNNSSDGPVIPVEGVSKLVVLKNIPSGFEYMGNISLAPDEVNKDYAKAENLLEAAEGIYAGTNNSNYYVTAMKFSDAASAESFLNSYKATFKVLKNNDTFQQIEVNNHEVTKGTSYPTVSGKQVPRYKYFWNNGNFVFLIEGNSEDPAVGLDFAKATGY